MRIYFFILYSMPILWIGCGSVRDLSNPVRPEPTENGMYIHPATKQPFDGVYDVVENGERLKMEIKGGWPTGLWQRWYPSSKQLKSEWNLIKNQRHGLQRTWYPNGKLMMETYPGKYGEEGSYEDCEETDLCTQIEVPIDSFSIYG